MFPGPKNEGRVPSGRGQMSDPAAVADPATGLYRHSSAKQPSTELTPEDLLAAERESLPCNLAELLQKDELIAALIQELEQAVEKLDRYERTGTAGAHQGAASSAPRSLASSSAPFMDNLERMAEDWEQAQPHTQLERIESQLAAMHDLVLNLQRHAPAQSDASYPNEQLRSLDSSQEGSSNEDVCDTTVDETSSSWESIKNKLLDSVPEASAEPFSVSKEDSELLRLLSETPTPANVDFNIATADVLKKAIEERDAYIMQLNKLVRMKNYFKLPTDWAALAGVPAEMQVRVNSLIEHLDVQVRMGEVEMSLERARLARERSQNQSEREQLEKHLRRLGLSSIADLGSISASTSSTGDRRWMRFIGSGSK